MLLGFPALQVQGRQSLKKVDMHRGLQLSHQLLFGSIARFEQSNEWTIDLGEWSDSRVTSLLLPRTSPRYLTRGSYLGATYGR